MFVGKVLISLAGIILCLLLFAVTPASAENYSVVDRQPTTVSDPQTVNGKDIETHDYHGYLRLFVSEPVSRFSNDLGQPHLHGVIGYPLDMEINLNNYDTLKGDLVYNGNGMNSSNIEVIGAVYEFEGKTNYSDPPSGYPFTARLVDAAAVATPGNPGVEAATLPYTHTVFVEYATRYS